MNLKNKIAQNEEADKRVKEAIAEMEGRVLAMPLETWLKAIKQIVKFIGKDHAMREYVVGLHKRRLMYHFDDCAIDCLVDTNATGTTRSEAELINELTKMFYSEEMFDLAMQLHKEEEV